MNRPHVLKRAFELARSGTIGTIDALVRELKREGFLNVDAHLEGGTRLRRELTALSRESWAAAGNEPIRQRK